MRVARRGYSPLVVEEPVHFFILTTLGCFIGPAAQPRCPSTAGLRGASRKQELPQSPTTRGRVAVLGAGSARAERLASAPSRFALVADSARAYPIDDAASEVHVTQASTAQHPSLLHDKETHTRLRRGTKTHRRGISQTTRPGIC